MIVDIVAFISKLHLRFTIFQLIVLFDELLKGMNLSLNFSEMQKALKFSMKILNYL